MNGYFKLCLCKFKNLGQFLQRSRKINNPLRLLVLLLCLYPLGMVAQYTGVINSNRPGFSESPYSVGTGVYQFETSYFLRKVSIEPTFSRPRSSGINLLFRTSFLKEQLELNLDLSYQKDQVAFKNIFTSSYNTSGLGKFTLGAKYLLYEQEYKDKSKEIRSWVERHKFDWKRLIPSVAVYAGINTDFVNDIHKTGGMTPKFGVLLQNDLTRDLNVITNIYYDQIGSDFSNISYIVTTTYSFNDRWSTFFENQSIFDNFKNSTNFGSGFAYLYNRNLQLNSSLRFVAEGKATGIYTSFGLSYRIDKHEDELVELDERGNPIKEDEGTVKKKGFFEKIWGKITGIFKGKKKKTAEKVELKDKSIESIKKNTNEKEPTIQNENAKEGKPVRTRPKRVRKKPYKINTKKVEKKQKKEQKREEKEIEKEERALKKEEDKLKKEIEREKRKAQKKEDQKKKTKEEDEKKKEDDND